MSDAAKTVASASATTAMRKSLVQMQTEYGVKDPSEHAKRQVRA